MKYVILVFSLLFLTACTNESKTLSCTSPEVERKLIESFTNNIDNYINIYGHQEVSRNFFTYFKSLLSQQDIQIINNHINSNDYKKINLSLINTIQTNISPTSVSCSTTILSQYNNEKSVLPLYYALIIDNNGIKRIQSPTMEKEQIIPILFLPFANIITTSPELKHLTN